MSNWNNCNFNIGTTSSPIKYNTSHCEVISPKKGGSKVVSIVNRSCACNETTILANGSVKVCVDTGQKRGNGLQSTKKIYFTSVHEDGTEEKITLTFLLM